VLIHAAELPAGRDGTLELPEGQEKPNSWKGYELLVSDAAPGEKVEERERCRGGVPESPGVCS